MSSRMEKKLSALMDYQKFEKNAALEQVISSVHARYALAGSAFRIRELNLDEMEMLSAAGMPEREWKKKGHEQTGDRTDL